MRINKVKSTILVGVILTLFVASSFAVQPAKVEGADAFFTLVAKTNGGGVRPDYLNFLKQHLARIGINVNVIVQDWPSFVMELIAFRDFDICYVALTGGGADPDMTGVYNENGSLNLFGYHTSMDFNETLGTGVNEWYMKQGNLIMPPNSAERIQHYWDWEQYLMDKILPCQPTFIPQDYTALWSNLQGYNISDGIKQSWGKMYWEGSHTGQASTNEVVIADAAWSDLNPFFQDDASSAFISGATLDPLLKYDSDLTVWPHLAKWWKMINDTHVRINLRQGIKWQADKDGNFTDEYLDIKDVYFTLYTWQFWSSWETYLWLEDMRIVNSTCMDIYIDGDYDTPENEPFAPFLPSISLNILPEHYLNQTQLADGVTPDINHPSWEIFSTKCFGTSLFQLVDYDLAKETNLTVYNDCWLLNKSISKQGMDFNRRFGNFTQSPERLRVRVIPSRVDGLNEFESGKLDLFDVSYFDDTRRDYATDSRFNVQNETMFYLAFFGYNMRENRPQMGNREPCPKDPDITKGLALRKAISYAIDRNEINNLLHKGEYTITDHPIYHRQGIWCNPDIIRYDHNITLAKEYMSLSQYEPTTTSFNLSGWKILLAVGSCLVTTFVVTIKYKKQRILH
jgi:ABC-type transport system substrate-binding protein